MTATQAPAAVYGRPLNQVARELGIHLVTLHRWRERGIADANGQRRHPKMTRVGGRWYVRDADLDQFFSAISTDGSATTLSVPEPQAAPSRAAERAARELAAAGI